MDAALGGAGSQSWRSITEAFARCAQEGQQKNGESVQQEQAVAALRIVDPHFAHAMPKRRSRAQKLGSMVQRLP
jgi:hypothetical protein